MKTSIGITEANRKAVAATLNKLLADEHVLYVKVRNAHWNVEGPDFHSQHVFFESIYNELAIIIDEIAERVRTIGHYAVGTMKEFLELSELTELRHEKNDSQGYIKELLSDFDAIVVYLREEVNAIDDKYKDTGTQDFLVAIIEKHEKTGWMLRAHLR